MSKLNATRNIYRNNCSVQILRRNASRLSNTVLERSRLQTLILSETNLSGRSRSAASTVRTLAKRLAQHNNGQRRRESNEPEDGSDEVVVEAARAEVDVERRPPIPRCCCTLSIPVNQDWNYDRSRRS